LPAPKKPPTGTIQLFFIKAILCNDATAGGRAVT